MTQAIALTALFAVTASAQWTLPKDPSVPRNPDGKPNLTAPAPRGPDGKPDFSGVWQTRAGYTGNIAKDLKADAVQFQPWGEALYKHRVDTIGKDDPQAYCVLSGMPREHVVPYPFKILHTKGMMVFLYEALHSYRQIYMDGRKLPDDPQPAWMGYSVGRWEGDTLVVEAASFVEGVWIDNSGHPGSGEMRLTERFRRRDWGHINLELTITDPKAYKKPWTVNLEFTAMPDTDLIEYVCSENEKDIGTPRRKMKLLALLLPAIPLFAQWLSYPNPGVPRTKDGKPNLAAPPPKTATGLPDISGVWLPENQNFFQDLATGLKPEDIPYQPAARILQRQREQNEHADDPLARCLPHGVPRINTNGMYPFKIVQTPPLIVILYEQLGQFRQVFLDGRKLEPEPNPRWLGYSTGRLEGDSLIIETTGFNDKTWLDTGKGRPASDALQVQERFRRTNFGTLEIASTITDPKSYTKPWTTAAQKSLLQFNTDILEFVCNENEKDLPHLVGK